MEYYDYENDMNHVCQTPYEDYPFKVNPCMRNFRRSCPAQSYSSPSFAVPDFEEVDEEELFG